MKQLLPILLFAGCVLHDHIRNLPDSHPWHVRDAAR